MSKKAEGLTITENDKQILKSTLPLVAVILLFVFAGKFAFSQIQKINSQIKETKKTQSVLSQKLSTLRSVSQLTVSGTNAAITALPKSNPSLQVVSQIRNLASSNLLLIQDVRSSASDKSSSQIPHVTTSFNLVGSKEAISAFIKGIDSIAPISFVDKVSLTQDGGAFAANISIKTYYAPLPSTIPTITQPVTDLTASEKELLNQISGLTQPTLNLPVTATVSGSNPNPFGI